jgi:hypothetical protein
LTTAAAIAVLGFGLEAASDESTSEKYALTTYRERVSNVTVLVDSFPASMHDGGAFVPVTVAVGLVAGGNVTVTPESFQLFDRSGNVYPAVSYGEILESYDRLAFDATLARRRPIVVGQQFVLSDKLQASFYPNIASGVRVDNIHLAPYTWFETVVYFPRPIAGLGGVMALEVAGGGIESPIYVKFRVPGRNGQRQS